MAQILEVTNLSKHFGGVHALSGITFAVPENAIVAIIGPNGSGKTTCLNCINGIYTLDGGEIRFRGQVIVGLRPHVIAQSGIGRTFQVPRVFRRMSLVDNLFAPVLNCGKSNEELRRQACDLLERVGMLKLKDNLGEEISGGQQKLIELLRLWMADPDLILLDEPFAGVHPDMKSLFFEEIKRLRGLGKTFILISHDMKSVYTLSDEILVLDLGRIIARGTEATIKVDERVIDAYLGK
jgi:branched-chain amino acid transport system ATP-binding protein